MVLDNDGVEDILEHVIGVLVTSIDTAVLVVKLEKKRVQQLNKGKKISKIKITFKKYPKKLTI